MHRRNLSTQLVQKYPFVFIIECETGQDSQQQLYINQLRHEIINCSNYQINVYLNKIPRALLREGNCFIGCQFLVSNDANYPFIHLMPRPGSFEISYGRDLVWSKLQTGAYPRIVQFKQRCANIIRSEQNIDFVDMSRLYVNNLPQSNIKPRMRSTKIVPELFKEKHFVSKSLHLEFKQKQYMTKIMQHFKHEVKTMRSNMIEHRRRTTLDHLKNFFNKQIIDRKQKLIMMQEKAKLEKEKKEALLKKQRDQIMARFTEGIRIKVKDLQIIQSSKLQGNLARNLLEFTLIDKNGNVTRPFEKYACMSLDELYENMSLDEMLICPDFPVEMIVKKMRATKTEEDKGGIMPPELRPVKKISGTKQTEKNDDYLLLSSQNNEPKVNRHSKSSQNYTSVKKSRLLTNNLMGHKQPVKLEDKHLNNLTDSQSVMDEDSFIKGEADEEAEQINSKHMNFLSQRLSKNVDPQESLIVETAQEYIIQSQHEEISLAQDQQLSALDSGLSLQQDHEPNKKTTINDQDYETYQIKSQTTKIESEQHTSMTHTKPISEVVPKQLEKIVTTDPLENYNLMTKPTWIFKIDDRDYLNLDSNRTVMINQQRTRLIMEKFKFIMSKQLLKHMVQQEGRYDLIEMNSLVTLKYMLFTEKNRLVQLDPTQKMDVVSKQLTIIDKETGQKKVIEYDKSLNSKPKASAQSSDVKAFQYYQSYDFNRWGWLANTYIKNKGYVIPSWNQIKDSIAQEEVDQERQKLHKNQKKQLTQDDIDTSIEIAKTLQNLINVWDGIFDDFDEVEKYPQPDQPIQEKDFKNPYGYTVRNTLYLYSLDTYLYRCLNWACRSQNYIERLGCFAVVLSRVLKQGSRYREESITNRIVFRGLTLTPDDINSYRQNHKINLAGYASTSQNINESLGFAFGENNPFRKPVLFHIDLHNDSQNGFCFKMNSECYTAFPKEEEILLDDGRPFEITGVEKDQLIKGPDYFGFEVQSKYKNRPITIIKLKSMLPQGINKKDEKTIQRFLQSHSTYKNFIKSGETEQPKAINRYMCMFQSEFRDKSVRYRYMQSDLVPNSFTDHQVGFLSAVSKNKLERETIYFEPYSRYPVTSSAQFLGHNCFRLYISRKTPEKQKYGFKQKEVRRYLSVDPAQNKKNHLNEYNDTEMLVSWEPDERRASIWHFDMLKSNSNHAFYIIVNRKWLWHRCEKNQSQQGGKAFEQCSYLAFGALCSHGPQHLKKSESASYMFLTRNKYESAVWQCRQVPARGTIIKEEIALSKKIHKIALKEWIFKPEHEQFSNRNILSFPIINFFDDGTFMFTVKYQQHGSQKANQTHHLGFFDGEPIERDSYGTWSFIKSHQKKYLTFKFDDEEQSRKSNNRNNIKKDHEHCHAVTDDDQELIQATKGTATFVFVNSQVSNCHDSMTHRFIKGFQIIKTDDENYVQIRELLKGTIIKDDKGRNSILDLLPEGMTISKHLYFCQSKHLENSNDGFSKHGKPEGKYLGSEVDQDHIAKEFHQKCDNHKTLIIIKVSDGQVIGGYTEVNWHSQGSLGVGRQSERKNSFLFYQNPDGRCKFDTKNKKFERFHKFVVQKDQNEIFHGSNYAANFIELKLRGPDQYSEFTPKGKCYNLPVGFIEKQSNYPALALNSQPLQKKQTLRKQTANQNGVNVRGDVQLFQYQMMDVFAVNFKKNYKKKKDNQRHL